jgi:hypothetical protein
MNEELKTNDCDEIVTVAQDQNAKQQLSTMDIYIRPTILPADEDSELVKAGPAEKIKDLLANGVFDKLMPCLSEIASKANAISDSVSEIEISFGLSLESEAKAVIVSGKIGADLNVTFRISRKKENQG